MFSVGLIEALATLLSAVSALLAAVALWCGKKNKDQNGTIVCLRRMKAGMVIELKNLQRALRHQQEKWDEANKKRGLLMKILNRADEKLQMTSNEIKILKATIKAMLKMLSKHLSPEEMKVFQDEENETDEDEDEDDENQEKTEETKEKKKMKAPEIPNKATGENEKEDEDEKMDEQSISGNSSRYPTRDRLAPLRFEFDENGDPIENSNYLSDSK